MVEYMKMFRDKVDILKNVADSLMKFVNTKKFS